MPDTTLTLTGLDGSNPLSFMAALGLLRILDEHRIENAKMRWVLQGLWCPQLPSGFELRNLADAIHQDLQAWRDAQAFSLAYDKQDNEKRCSRLQQDADNEVKASPALMHSFLDELAENAVESDRTQLDWLVSIASDVVVDNNGKIKPSALHFYAGKQRFLDAANELCEALGDQADASRDVFVKWVREALLGPWLRNKPLKSFSWDATVQRDYALRATNPSGGKKQGSVPVAEWLALRGLATFPSFPHRSRLLTSCVDGNWNRGALIAVLWSPWLSLRTASSLLQTFVPPEHPGALSPKARKERGIAAVWRCRFERFGQGYGRFLPAMPA